MPGLQDARDHLRHGGLAVAAGHRDQRQIEVGAPGLAEIDQCGARVVDEQAVDAGLDEAALRQRGHRAGRLGLRQEVVRIEAFALERDEEITGLQRAGVAVHAQDVGRTVADQRGAGQQFVRVLQGHHGAHALLLLPSARWTFAPLDRIGERVLDACDLLVVLVALAGDQHHVARVGLADRVGDGLATILDHRGVVVADEAGEDLRQDEARCLVARVVAGDDDLVGQPLRDSAHQRALGRIAVAAAAEHAPQPAAARLGQRLQRLQHLLQRIGRVGVVDNDLRLACRRDALHASRHRGHVRADARRVVERHTQRAQAADHRQQVARVVLADQPTRHVDAFRAFVERERQAAIAIAEPARAQPRFALDRIGPQVEVAAGTQRIGELGALLVVDVDHRRLQPRPAEQLHLGIPVGLHAAVVIQVVAREVGEERHHHPRTRHALLDDADRRGLDRARGVAEVDEAAEGAVQQHRVGGRQAGEFDAVAFIGGGRTDARRLADAQRADHTRA